MPINELRQDMRTIREEVRGDISILSSDIRTVIEGIGRIDERLKSVETGVTNHSNTISDHTVKVVTLENDVRRQRVELSRFKKTVWGTFSGFLTLGITYITNMFSNK